MPANTTPERIDLKSGYYLKSRTGVNGQIAGYQLHHPSMANALGYGDGIMTVSQAQAFAQAMSSTPTADDEAVAREIVQVFAGEYERPAYHVKEADVAAILAKHRVGQAAPYGAESGLREDVRKLKMTLTHEVMGLTSLELATMMDTIDALEALAQSPIQVGDEVGRLPSIAIAIAFHKSMEAEHQRSAKNHAETSDVHARHHQMALHHRQSYTYFEGLIGNAALTKDSPASEHLPDMETSGGVTRPVSGEGCIPDGASPALKRAARELAAKLTTPAQEDAAGIIRGLCVALKDAIPDEEFNLSNYDHETVCRISRMQHDCSEISKEALTTANNWLNEKGGAIGK